MIPATAQRRRRPASAAGLAAHKSTSVFPLMYLVSKTVDTIQLIISVL